MTKRYVISTVLAAVSMLMLSQSAVMAKHRDAIRGVYGASVNEFCVETPREPPPAEGFDEETGALLVDANATTAVISGEMRFTRGGRTTLEGGTISDLFIDQTRAGDVPAFTGTPLFCEGSHEVDRQRRLAVELVCTAELPGNVVVTVGPLLFDGFVSNSRSSVVLSSVAGNVQTESISVNGNPVLERERVCLLTGNLVKLRRR